MWNPDAGDTESELADRRHVLVLGLGNPILTDDGVGVKVAERVFRALPTGAPVEVREVSVGGLTLMEHMVGWDKVILVDALRTGRSPSGTIRRLTLEDLRSLSPTQHSASAHDASLVTAIGMAERMKLAVPDHVVIFAVEVENVIDFCEEPTPAVAKAIPEVADMVLDQLAEWGVAPDPAHGVRAARGTRPDRRSTAEPRNDTQGGSE